MPHAGSASDVFHAIADDTRRALLDRLSSGEEAATSLSVAFHISQPAVSQHLKVLRHAGLVAERREGRFRLYRLQPEALREVAAWVAHYESFWKHKLGALGKLLNEIEGRTALPPAVRARRKQRRGRNTRRG
jgi:DNA-binding transcriptional ArsR family regulator